MVTVKIIIIRREEEEEEEETLIQNMTKSYKMLSSNTCIFVYLFICVFYLFIYLCNHEVMVNDSDILGTALSNVNIDTT